MKFSLLTYCLSLTACVLAALVLEEQTFGFGCLNAFFALEIVNKYISILENQPYYGQSVNTTAEQIIASNYLEYSDSMLSLEKAPVCSNPFSIKDQG
jgi:hypothetical protein